MAPSPAPTPRHSPSPVAPGGGRRVLGVGELLWDLLPTGPRLGGAPFNVVAHLHRLGFDAAYLTAVGSDELGTRARAEVERLGVDASLIQPADLPTGIVRVALDAAGVPAYEIVSPAAYEAVEFPRWHDADRFEVLVFGTLAQRFPNVHAATDRLAASAPDAIRLYDVNLRHGCWNPDLVRSLAEIATVVKMNQEEAATLAREFDLPDAGEPFARALAAQHRLRGVCVTRGADGAALLLDGAFSEAAAAPVVVADTVGAGDAFAACLAAGIAAGWPIDSILDVAGRLAALVASREGAIPDWELSELGSLPGSGFDVARPPQGLGTAEPGQVPPSREALEPRARTSVVRAAWAPQRRSRR